MQAKNRVDKGFPTAAKGDSLDWKDYDAETIFQRVSSRVEPGSIVLFHNAALHTPEALPGIIEHLLQNGYYLVLEQTYNHISGNGTVCETRFAYRGYAVKCDVTP